MKRVLWVIVAGLLVTTARARAIDIGALLDTAAEQPGVEISALAVTESVLQEKSATAALYPKIGLFGQAEVFNSPTNLRPMPPTEVNIQSGESIPFSREILRYGATLEMPLYIRQLYVLRQKVRLLTDRADIAHRINRVSREAAVVSLNSTFAYLAGLDQAVAARLKSLEKTRDDVALKVKTGRSAEAELLKVLNSINDLEQQRNDLDAAMLDIRRDIRKLTDVSLSAPVAMRLADDLTPGPLLAVEQVKKEVAAAAKEVQRRRAARYPTLSLFGTVSGNDGKAFNTDSHIFRSYNFAGVTLKFPLFDKSLATDEEIARVQLKKTQKKLQDTRIQLHALERNLRKKLPVIDRSLALARKSVENNRQLLAIARVAYDSGRTTTEEYLRWEERLLASHSAVLKARQERWQVLAQQAVLYGTDLRGVVK